MDIFKRKINSKDIKNLSYVRNYMYTKCMYIYIYIYMHSSMLLYIYAKCHFPAPSYKLNYSSSTHPCIV